MAGKLFLEKLLLKLKTGNSRSIHLNALPGRFARLDLHEFVNIWQGLHLRLVDDLLKKQKFRFSISIDPKHVEAKTEEERRSIGNIAARLNSLFYQQQDEFLEHGTKTFALGFPLLIMRDVRHPEKILKAPLIIWHLELEKDLHQSNTWTISRNEESPILFNEVLRAHIETHEQIKLDDVMALLDDEDGITEQILTGLCSTILAKLGTTPTALDLELKVLPGTNREGIEKITEQHPWIRWSGIFGLYRTQKQSIIKDVEQFQREPELLTGKSSAHNDLETPTISAVPTDPSQEYILSSLRRRDQLIVQGPPGTGKSQSLTAIITDALYHGKTSLVVCEKKTALDVIRANLAATGLSDHCIIIEDVYRDRKQVVERVRHLLEIRNEDSKDAFRHHEFNEAKQEFENLRQNIRNHLRLINETCFGDDSLSDLTARVRKLEMENIMEPFDGDPGAHFEDAGYKRFRELKKIIGSAAQLFQPLGRSLSFDNLNDSLFDGKVPARSIFSEIDPAITTLSEFLATIVNAKDRYGDLFSDNRRRNRWKLKVGSLVSTAYRNAQRSRKAVLKWYPEFRSDWNDSSYLDISLPEIKDSDSLDVIEQPLKDMHDLFRSMSDQRDKIDHYEKWRRYMQSLDTRAAGLIMQLSGRVPSDQWDIVFSRDYMAAFIKQYCDRHGLKSGFGSDLGRLKESSHRLSEILPAKINQIRSESQSATLQKRTITGVKQLYNLRRNKTYGRRNSLRKIIREDVDLFTAAFPVVLVNPTVCSSIFPLQKDLFDQVIFDEASQLRLEDTFAALFRGRKKIISGDKHQMPPSAHFMSNVVLMDAPEEETSGITDDFLAESNSLLEYGMDSDFRNVFLDFHYRSRHPDLIAFSNSAFYGNRLVPMPVHPANDGSPLEYYQVDGTYTKQRTNPEEALAIVNYIYGNISGEVLPSVGIATFNVNQRNHIWDLLLQATFEDPVKAAHLDRLMEQGLFVKNLENIQGDERDIMLISTTFGTDETGGFRQQFGPLTRSDGYRLLNVIITRARDKMAVFSSIPSSVRSGYAQLIEEKGLAGNAIFYSWLAYVEAAASGRTKGKQHLLELMDRHCVEKPFLHESRRMPLFHQLIYTGLLDKYGKDRVAHNFRLGGFILDLTILEGGRPVVAISTSHMKQQTTTSYKMFLFKPEMLEQYGVKVYVADVLDWYAGWEKQFNDLTFFIEEALSS